MVWQVGNVIAGACANRACRSALHQARQCFDAGCILSATRHLQSEAGCSSCPDPSATTARSQWRPVNDKTIDLLGANAAGASSSALRDIARVCHRGSTACASLRVTDSVLTRLVPARAGLRRLQCLYESEHYDVRQRQVQEYKDCDSWQDDDDVPAALVSAFEEARCGAASGPIRLYAGGICARSPWDMMVRVVSPIWNAVVGVADKL